MARTTVAALGPFEVVLDGQPVTCLVTGRERTHTLEVLAGLLWPDLPERSARTKLRSVRSALGPLNHTTPT